MASMMEGIESADFSVENPRLLQKFRSSKKLPHFFSDRIVSTLRSMSDHENQSLNLVLCGRRGPMKSSAAQAFLEQTKLHSRSTSSEARWISLVDLPSLSQVAGVKEDLFSLCDPEGVHVFMLVLPIDHLTDEDKRELRTIQKMCSSLTNALTMILFTVTADQTTTDIESFIKRNMDTQEILQMCERRYMVVTVKDKQQIQERLDSGKKERMDTFETAELEKALKWATSNKKFRDRFLEEVQRQERDGNPTPECLRMVLIGKTGSGKSATANSITGQKHFTPRAAPKPANTTCEEATGEIDGRKVEVVNTPGLFDTSLSDEEIQQELYQCIRMLAPGPHVFLLVLQIGNITEEEKDSVELIKRVFGKKAQDFIIIVFTRGEALEGQSIEGYMKDSGLKQLVNDCGERYQVLNHNTHQDNPTQVRELLAKIEAMLRANGGGYYKAEIFQFTKDAFDRQVRQIVKKEQDASKRQHEEMQQKITALEKEKNQNQEELEKVQKQLKEIKNILTEKSTRNNCNVQ